MSLSLNGVNQLSGVQSFLNESNNSKKSDLSDMNFAFIKADLDICANDCFEKISTVSHLDKKEDYVDELEQQILKKNNVEINSEAYSVPKNYNPTLLKAFGRNIR